LVYHDFVYDHLFFQIQVQRLQQIILEPVWVFAFVFVGRKYHFVVAFRKPVFVGSTAFRHRIVIFYYVVYEDREYRKWAMLCSPLLFFFIIVSVRMSFDTISLMTILTNPVLATIVDLPIPLIDLIK